MGSVLIMGCDISMLNHKWLLELGSSSFRLHLKIVIKYGILYALTG